MKKAQWICYCAIILFIATGCNSRSGKPRVLLFTRIAGTDHVSPPAGIQAILTLGSGHNFDVDTTSDASRFQEDSLQKYCAVVFLNTNGSLLNHYQRADFERYIQAGGGYAGIHAAPDAKYDWGWYGRLTGGTDSSGRHDFDGGRAWYTASGYKDSSYADTAYLRQLTDGIEYAIGDNKNLNYSKATSLRAPEEDRFTKTPVTMGEFFEPTEMTILPNLDILVAQRRGEIMLYKSSTKTVKQAGYLDVYWKTKHTPGVNAEEGLLGIQMDPGFKTNHFVYIYYSPADTSVNRLSRFTLTGDSIDTKSEKIILQLYSQREICCHTGGSIAFGQDNTLFVSTGDNSTPFDEPNTPYPSHGYAPLDDRPGHLQYDSRRGAGNTNDLRGKILRIKLNPDGSYNIPEGNLFPKGEPKTRPEIYIMGDRNPYRISVDKKNGYLYWGEVGPDANQDSLETRGPRGYDEVNQARKAGFFGWPYFVGNNYAYHVHDYATDANGPAFDPAHPVNDSRNNTGLRELPSAQPAFIWYPYAESPDFPAVGSGGRCAMAGPVFYSDLYPQETRMPDYYNGKFIMYDFTRCWFKAVTLLPNGDFDKMEPFMEHTKFNSPIDAEMGPDGKLYILEYGNGWFSKNADAGISRIDFNGGNRSPKISEITIDKTSGDLPLKITVTVEAKDPENDKLRYIWDLGNGVKKETDGPKLEYTLTTAGDYAISVEVKDDKSEPAISSKVNVYAGNEAPSVSIALKGNKTFYFPGTPVAYKIDIEDKDDTAKNKDMNDLVVSADYTEGSDKAAVPQGHQTLSAAAVGKNLTQSLDCKSCHKPNEKSIGPAFQDVAERYAKDPDMVPYLVQKITKGGSGKWGEVAMPAHPALKEEDIRQIIGWIQTLSGANKTIKSLPPAGSVNATLDKPEKDKGILTITASYTDKGGNNIKPLTGSHSLSLQNSKMSFSRISGKHGYSSYHDNGTTYLKVPKDTGWCSTDSIDLSTIRTASLMVNWTKGPVGAYTFELHLDSPGGEKIGSFIFKGDATGAQAKPKQYFNALLSSKLEQVKDGQYHKLFITSRAATAGGEQLALSFLQFNNK
ncbi:MAG TPA: PQQ-dependent sugar dehydrogenase [Puia sp.]|nr:PQQ-dependent sugar dehydrogenase [Puia sp.]